MAVVPLHAVRPGTAPTNSIADATGTEEAATGPSIVQLAGPVGGQGEAALPAALSFESGCSRVERAGGTFVFSGSICSPSFVRAN